MTMPGTTAPDVAEIASGFIEAEASQLVHDMAHHVGDEVHAVLTRHGMMMATTGNAIGMGVLAAVEVLTGTIEFATRSMDGDASDIASIRTATVRLFLDSLPDDLRAHLLKDDR